ncbi:nitroreductase family protein [Roseiconus nitratireducens]|uniref:Nitroreductase family protein n=1 Tax=Roseiconus nitratireducens TaxID=2605748 RepID=A0A5M6CU97_9BACT|nr:nitroreductase family protein [Roseiconus nitratireducens]KAA5538761.1 nitroreductase family protein [Roseiconus nitratireducens]
MTPPSSGSLSPTGDSTQPTPRSPAVLPAVTRGATAEENSGTAVRAVQGREGGPELRTDTSHRQREHALEGQVPPGQSHRPDAIAAERAASTASELPRHPSPAPPRNSTSGQGTNAQPRPPRRSLVRRIKERWRRRWLDLACRWRPLSGLHCLISGELSREAQAMLRGRQRHLMQLEEAGGEAVLFQLRRNTHRLEKGLIMRPRRPQFALDYIAETVASFEQSVADATGGKEVSPGQQDDCQTLRWARDVLGDYFRVVRRDAMLDGLFDRYDAARQRFDDSLHTSSEAHALTPYRRDLQPLGVSIDDFERLAWRRRSVRWYQQRPVPREVIDRAIRIAGLSPSACNRQPFQFRVYDDPALVQRIGAIPGGTAGFAENFPGLVVLVGQMQAFPLGRDRHVIYIDASLAAMSFQYALELQGVGSCCINWPDVESRERQMAEAIGLAGHERVVMLISFGYPDPDGMVPCSSKKPLHSIRSYNQR